jgi:hypothetical protein
MGSFFMSKSGRTLREDPEPRNMCSASPAPEKTSVPRGRTRESRGGARTVASSPVRRPRSVMEDMLEAYDSIVDSPVKIQKSKSVKFSDKKQTGAAKTTPVRGLQRTQSLSLGRLMSTQDLLSAYDDIVGDDEEDNFRGHHSEPILRRE